MSRSPKDKPTEEVSVPTAVRSRRKGRTKLWPVDRPRYVMSLSKASNPYKGQSGETGQSVTSTINRRGRRTLILPSCFTHMNRIKIDVGISVPFETSHESALNDNDVNRYYYTILNDDALITVTYIRINKTVSKIKPDICRDHSV